jgi:hypothetical protein
MKLFHFSILIIIISQLYFSCTSPKSFSYSKQDSIEAIKKIAFDISQIDKKGLIGPEDGKRLVAYEFCIPYDKQKHREVESIDKSIKFFHGSTGRAGCSNNEYLCIGEGASPAILIQLAKLNYIRNIYPFYGE